MRFCPNFYSKSDIITFPLVIKTSPKLLGEESTSYVPTQLDEKIQQKIYIKNNKQRYEQIDDNN